MCQQPTSGVAGLHGCRKNRRGGVSTSNWKLEILPFVSGEEEDIFFCPEDLDRDQASSFGMNHRASRLGPKDPQGIVFLDYKDVTARIVGRSIEQLDAEWPAQYAARHAGQMNVVFHDGSGGTRNPDDIDPRYCEYYRKYWWPDRDIGMELDDCLTRPGRWNRYGRRRRPKHGRPRRRW